MGREDQAPGADTDPRRAPDPERVNMPERLRRERKPPYGPETGRTDEKRVPEKSRHARDQHVAEEKYARIVIGSLRPAREQPDALLRPMSRHADRVFHHMR